MNPDRIDLGSVEALYSGSLRAHGAVAQGLGWKHATDHDLRFAKLCSLFDLSLPLSVNDLGCGYGSLFDYLARRGANVSSFHGVDISEPMIREAQARYAGPKFDFRLGDRLARIADYSFASGIFNVRNEHSEDRWQEHMIGAIAHLNQHSTRGFAFNALTTYVDWKEPHLFYANPGFFFDHCKRNCSPRVALFHDYPIWEWTIVVLKE